MTVNSTFGGGQILIVMLGLLGALLLMISLFINSQVALYTKRDERHKEKQLEYYRNTFSQLGVILIGIGVSLFIFFFQQGFLERQRQNSQTQEILAKLGLRLSRAAPLLEFVSQIDPLLDAGGPYVDPDEGGSNDAINAAGADLSKQVEHILLLQREIDLDDFAAMKFSSDFQASTLINQMDPSLWFAMVKDEADLEYATDQLRQDFGDLQSALAARKADETSAEPGLDSAIKREALDVLWDYAWLRDRSRRLVARSCWFLSQGPKFLSVVPIPAVEARYEAHREWLAQAKKFYGQFSAGGENCYDMIKADG